MVNQYVDKLNKSPEVFIHIDYEKFAFDPVFGTLKLKQLSLQPKQQAKHLNLDLNFSAKAIDVFGIGLNKLITQDIGVAQLHIIEPKLKYYAKVDEEGKFIINREIGVNKEKEKSPWLHAIENTSLEHLRFADGEVELYKVREDTTLFLQLFGYNIEVFEKAVGELSDLNKSYISFDSLRFNLGKEFMLYTHGLYLDLWEKKLSLEDIYLRNQQAKIDYLNKNKYLVDWKEFKVDHLELTNLNLGELEQIKFHFDSLNLENLDIIVAERGDRKKPAGHQGKLINDWFMSIPKAVDFNYAFVKGGQINYQMYRAPFTGNMLLPFKLNSIFLSKDSLHQIEIDIDASIYDSPLYSQLAFYADSSYKTDVSIRIEDIKRGWFNKIAIPVFGAEITKGELSLLAFNYSYSGLYASAHGSMDFRYRDLKVRLQQRKGKNKEKKHGLLSFAANTVLKHNNYPEHNGYVKGAINYKRPLKKSFFGHMIKCMMQGLEYCVLKKK